MKRVNLLSLAAAAALAFAFVGCLNDSGPSKPADAQLFIQAGVKDVNQTKGLAKTAKIELRKLVITLTSSDTGDAVRRDTILANDSVGSSFTTDATDDQTVTRNYRVTPLRSWTITVKTLDAKDSVIHTSTTTASNLLVGETRAVTLNLSSRFVMYEAKFKLPDSLTFTQLDSLKQVLSVRRMVMIVDGDTVIDSSRTTRFSPDPTIHSIFFDYIDVNDTPDVKIEFFGSVGGDTTSTKLFEYLFEDVDPNDETPTVAEAEYTGPGASQLGSNAALTINIGKVGTVVFQPQIPTNVTTKKGAR